MLQKKRTKKLLVIKKLLQPKKHAVIKKSCLDQNISPPRSPSTMKWVETRNHPAIYD